jgi:hypothetical protein
MSVQNVLSVVLAFLALVWALPEVKFIVAHIAVNFVAAVAVTIYTEQFILNKFGQFLWKKLIPFVLLYAVFRLFGDYIQMPGIAVAVLAIIEVTLITDLTDNLSRIPALAGVIPAILKKPTQAPPC